MKDELVRFPPEYTVYRRNSKKLWLKATYRFEPNNSLRFAVKTRIVQIFFLLSAAKSVKKVEKVQILFWKKIMKIVIVQKSNKYPTDIAFL